MSDHMATNYDPRDHTAGGKEVKSAWVMVLIVNLGLIIFTF